LSDLTLKYHNGYVEAGLTPTFLPPSQPVFTPEIPKEYDESDFYFEEILDENGNWTYKQLRDTHYYMDIFYD
jgi:hypothetical protein